MEKHEYIMECTDIPEKSFLELGKYLYLDGINNTLKNQKYIKNTLINEVFELKAKITHNKNNMLENDLINIKEQIHKKEQIILAITYNNHHKIDS